MPHARFGPDLLKIVTIIWEQRTDVFIFIYYTRVIHIYIINHQRSIAVRRGCFQRHPIVCLLLCLFVNTITSEKMTKDRMMKLGGWVHCTKILPEFEFGGHRPRIQLPATQNVTFC